MNRDFTVPPGPTDAPPGRAERSRREPSPSALAFAFDDRSEGRPLDEAAGDIRIHTDEKAARLADGLDADAFTRGPDIFFAAGKYDPGTKAGRALLQHELGHVAQQARGEVDGHAGTVVPEDHATERLADSGAALRQPGRSVLGRGDTIQRQPKKKPLTQAEAADPLWVLDVVLHYGGKHNAIAASSYRDAFAQLYGALEGEAFDDGKRLSERTRSELFDKAILGLREVLALADDATRSELAARRARLIESEAVERSATAVEVDGKVIEVSEAHPEEEAEATRELLKKLAKTAGILNERIKKLAEAPKAEVEKAIHEIRTGPHSHELETFLETLEHDAGKRSVGIGALESLQGLIGTLDGLLTIQEKDFQEHINDARRVFPTIEAYSEFVKVVLEFAAGGVGFATLLTAGLARAVGEIELAKDALRISAELGDKLKIGNAIGAIEVVHGIAVILDPDATRAQKLDAAVDVASGGSLLLGSTPVSVAIAGGWLFFKEEVYLYWHGALGINDLLMEQTFEFMQGQGAIMSDQAKTVVKARGILANETDPVRAEALAKLADDEERTLASNLDFFLAHCLPPGAPGRPKDMGWLGDMQLAAPGNVDMLAEAFAPLQRYRGVGPGPGLPVATAHVLARVKWCLANAQAIVRASTLNLGLAKVARGPERPEEYPDVSKAQVAKEIGSVPAMWIEFTARGHRPEDVSVVRTVLPGLDPLWYVTGTSADMTLGDLSAGAALVMEWKGLPGGPVRFTRDASGRLAYDDVPSTTGDYFRAVAIELGQRFPTMREESFSGMIDVYARIMATPVNEAHLQP